VVVYIASHFLSATIDDRGLDVVSMTLDKPCDAVQPLPKAKPYFVGAVQPVVLVHFPLCQDNSTFNTHCALKKAKLGEKNCKEESTESALYIRTKPSLGEGKGITFAPGENALVEPLLSSGTLRGKYPKHGRGFANYQRFQNSSGGAVVMSTQDGWQLLGIHIGATAPDDNSAPLTHILLSPEQLENAGVKPSRTRRSENLRQKQKRKMKRNVMMTHFHCRVKKQGWLRILYVC